MGLLEYLLNKLNKTKNNILLTILLILIPFCLNSKESSSEENPATGEDPSTEGDPPNVILILADDMGMGDMSCVNEGRSRTPNLDRLVKESVWFDHAYAASCVCAPSRAALLTGRYPHRTGVVTLNPERYPGLTSLYKDEVTMADVFSANGYATGMIGKWHIGNREEYHPRKRGFHEYEFFRWPYVNGYYDYKLDVQGKVLEFQDKYLTDDLSDRAVAFINRHKDEPFFLHLAHYAPHRPLEAPEETINYYLKKGFNKNTSIIYAMIEIMDRGIGELLAELDNLGLKENTIIIFSSDNGPDPIPGERFNQNLRGTKYTVYEGGIHVPFIVNWPGTLEPGERDEIINFIDVFPTLADICGLELPNTLNLDGGSFAGVLFDGKYKNTLPEYYFWQWNRGVPCYSHNATIREGDWKLVRPFVTTGVPEQESNLKPVLYNLKDDPYEKKDVSEEYPVIYDKMRVLLEKWCREVEYERLRRVE